MYVPSMVVDNLDMSVKARSKEMNKWATIPQQKKERKIAVVVFIFWSVVERIRRGIQCQTLVGFGGKRREEKREREMKAEVSNECICNEEYKVIVERGNKQFIVIIKNGYSTGVLCTVFCILMLQRLYTN